MRTRLAGGSGRRFRLLITALLLVPFAVRFLAGHGLEQAMPADGRSAPPNASTRRIPRPFEGQYAVTLTCAILALAPFIVITTARALFDEQLQQELHLSRAGMEIIAGLSTAGYAWGALWGGDIAQRLPRRPLFMVCEAVFVLGCLLASVAEGPVLYGTGHVLAGFATGLLLVVAVPPVVQRFPAAKLPITVVAINIGFFGAVCIGPLLGGWVAAGHHWRWFYGALAVLGFANLALAILTLPDQAPPDPGLRFDWPALALGLAATALPFWAVGELSGPGFASPRFAVPLFVGLACFVALLLLEYHHPDPLSPVKPMWTTMSVTGTLVAMVAGAVFVTLLELGERFHMQVMHRSPLQTGVLFWPMAVGVLVTAALFGAILRTRFIPVLILAGMAALSVTIIGRIFALVELVRSLADYLLAPVMLRIAQDASAARLDTRGVHVALWVTIWLSVALTGFGVFLYAAGGVGLTAPDLERWLNEKGGAIASPKLLARFRRA